MAIESGQFRILIVDDNEAIHDDLKKVLLPQEVDPAFAADEALLFGATVASNAFFEIDSAFQGQEGLERVLQAQASQRPYALAFVDVRMPPGWDGIETITHLWRADPELQIVICTAHSDYNWHEISRNLGVSHNFVVLKKPFDTIEVSQLAHAMTAKWSSTRQSHLQMEQLDRLVECRTAELFKANEQLKLLAAAVEAAANSICITNLEGNIVWTNPAFSALSGYSSEEVLGKNMRLLKSGKQDEEFYRELWTTISSGKTWHGELVNRQKNGNLTIEEMTITPVESETGTVGHFVAIKQDVTDRKQAEEALRKAEEKYRTIFEDAVVGIFQAAPEGRLLNINRAFANMHGYDSAEQLLGESPSGLRNLFVDPEQIDKWTRALEEHGIVRSAEVEVLDRQGTHKWVLVNIRVVRNVDGDIMLHEGTVEDVTVRKLAQKQVDFLAYYDALTGLPNRTLLKDRLDMALAACRRSGARAAVLFLDLDRFKVINDSLGHSFGDLLLQQVGNRLRGEIRDQDTVARVGGDEFLVVLTSVANVAEVEATAARIVSAVAGEYGIQDRLLSISCSLGISMFPEHGKDGETLIKNADAAMYCAKEQGTNTSCFFTDEMNARVMEHLTLESSLRSAIDRNEMFVVYQPQINIISGAVTGLEALLRWQHPEMGLVKPETFIRIAENSGLITALGEWVLRTVCSQIRRWLDAGFAMVPIAVNVSAVQFRHDGFRDMIKKVLHETRIEPKYLELELTESLLLSNADVMFTVLQELQDMGLKLVIDDFGTGYSSLSYLRHFPVTKLKIDRSFIRDVAVNPDAAAITTAIISMSKSLNLKVIAEGVEDEAQLAFLSDHGCDEFQGYYFSRPLNVKDVPAKLHKTLIQIIRRA